MLYGAMTVAQLLSPDRRFGTPVKVSAVTVEDAPRFGWRGLMLDVARHYQRIEAIYERATLERFLEAVKPDGVAILAGIIPLKSSKMGAWLNGNVPGIRVPDALLAQMQAVAGTDGEVAKGIDIAARTIRDSRCDCMAVRPFNQP